MIYSVRNTFLYSIVATITILALLGVASAQVRTSSNYQLQSDSINVGGGYSSSTNYVQESTVGEIATGPSDSSSYSLRAGYQQMQEVYLSLSSTGDVVMDTPLQGIVGGVSNGSSTFTVITDGPAGYQLTIEAENSPAMQRDATYSIADYDDGGTPDFTFDTQDGEAFFGFSPQGVDVVQLFLDDGGACGVGSQNNNLACWDGLSTSPVVISQANGSNHPSGATTTVNFRVELGANALVVSGEYRATSTVTALPL